MTLLATCSDLPGFCCDACHEDDGGASIEEEFDLSFIGLKAVVKTIRCCRRKIPERRDTGGWTVLATRLAGRPVPAV